MSRFVPQTVGFQRLQGWRGRFLQRRGVLLYRTERLAKLAPYADRGLVQALSTASLSAACSRASASTSPVVQFTAFRPITYDCPARQSSRSPSPCCPRAGKPRVRLGRQTLTGLDCPSASMSRFILRSETMSRKGDCSKLVLSALLQRFVEDCVSRLVIKVGQHDCVFVGQLQSL